MRPDVLRELTAETRRRKAEEQEHARQVFAAARQRAQVEVALLTGHEQWDTYLERIQALQTRDQQALDALVSEDATTDYRSPEEHARRRHEAAVLRARIEARSECQRIPKELLGPGSEAASA